MEHLNPRNDIAFKKIFGEEQNKDILIHFLNDVLNKTGDNKITEVTICNPNQLPKLIYSKESVLDVLCKDASGVQYIVEMQCSGRKGFEKRAQYYAAKAYSSQAKKNGTYKDLKEVIFLAILDYNMFPHKTHYKSDHIILDKKSYDHDLRDFYFTFIELPKFNKENPEELVTYEEKWCYFFKHAGELDNMRKFLSTLDDVAIIQKAYNVLEAHNWTEQELINYEAMEKRIMDARAREEFLEDQFAARLKEGLAESEAKGEAIGIAKGEAIGIAKGEAIGIQEEKYQVARKMKNKNYPLDDIILITGLTKDEIKQL